MQSSQANPHLHPQSFPPYNNTQQNNHQTSTYHHPTYTFTRYTPPITHNQLPTPQHAPLHTGSPLSHNQPCHQHALIHTGSPLSHNQPVCQCGPTPPTGSPLSHNGSQQTFSHPYPSNFSQLPPSTSSQPPPTTFHLNSPHQQQICPIMLSSPSIELLSNQSLIKQSGHLNSPHQQQFCPITLSSPSIELLSSQLPIKQKALSRAKAPSWAKASSQAKAPSQAKLSKWHGPPLERQDYLNIIEYLSNPNNYNVLFGAGKKTAVKGQSLGSAGTWDVFATHINSLYNQRTKSNLMGLCGSDLWLRFGRFCRMYVAAKRGMNSTGSGVTDQDRANGVNLNAVKDENSCACFAEMDALFSEKANITAMDTMDSCLMDVEMDDDCNSDSDPESDSHSVCFIHTSSLANLLEGGHDQLAADQTPVLHLQINQLKSLLKNSTTPLPPIAASAKESKNPLAQALLAISQSKARMYEATNKRELDIEECMLQNESKRLMNEDYRMLREMALDKEKKEQEEKKQNWQELQRSSQLAWDK
ncbi:uncharacterized protein MELLADRAFT_68029 [Melampsora larici-populina 98AG31]|uniref:No apical meristem-associated C-terminal domain-containing protein n=1 Tax=Melampsora larici-populina (strain 98AG31 / pathotype 3-4-7) TaxID=747676 RepID=F4S5B3_MELLP|nr:uncharacterized protein MELLADRAFT_68029 [Melampsora larici-populina 98AG31]EGG00136.1 hypothetical protein MELLADRAFT_68029 [Melampsora larici-populina 98AG31]